MRLLYAKDVAKILQVSPARVYELTRQGILPSVRIGARQVRFEETRLIEWIDHGGRLDQASLEDRLQRNDNPLGTGGANSSGARSGRDGGSLREEGRQGSRLCFDQLREIEPIHFVLECILRRS